MVKLNIGYTLSKPKSNAVTAILSMEPLLYASSTILWATSSSNIIPKPYGFDSDSFSAWLLQQSKQWLTSQSVSDCSGAILCIPGQRMCHTVTKC